MWQFLFSPYGRMSRKTYWLNWILPYLALSILVAVLDYTLFPIDPVSQEPLPIFEVLAGLCFLWPSIATTTKRLHDRGMTGWWNLAPILAIAPLAAAANWYYTTKLIARYGLAPSAVPPLYSPSLQIVVFWLNVLAIGVMLFFLVNTLFLRGQTGTNKYGSDPLGANQAEVFA